MKNKEYPKKVTVESKTVATGEITKGVAIFTSRKVEKEFRELAASMAPNFEFKITEDKQ